MYQDYIAPIRRHEFVDQSLRLGRKISSAASDHLILEASNRWQLTAWFGNGLVGMVELFDAESGGMSASSLLAHCLHRVMYRVFCAPRSNWFVVGRPFRAHETKVRI
jgi:hypothetical protein